MVNDGLSRVQASRGIVCVRMCVCVCVCVLVSRHLFMENKQMAGR